MKNELLRMEHIFKSYHEVNVLDDFKINIFTGEIHVILGLTVSGKTALTDILSGESDIDSGRIYFEEQTVSISSKSIAKKLGIYCLHSYSKLISQLSVAENIFVIKDSRTPKLFLNKKAIKSQTKMLLNEAGIDIPPDTLISDLSLAQRYYIELIKAEAVGAKLIVIEDFTGTFTKREVHDLIKITKKMKDKGFSFLIQTTMTDNLDELFEFSDRITVMRDGRNIKTLYKDEFDKDLILSLMIGHQMKSPLKRVSRAKSRVVLRAQGINWPELLNNVDFCLYEGEILGVLDIENKSNIKLAEIMTGMSYPYEGNFFINDSKVELKSREYAIRKGVGLISQDGYNSELLENMGVNENLIFLILKRVKKHLLFVSKRIVNFACRELIHELEIPLKEYKTEVKYVDVYTRLKILYLRWILFKPKVLVCIKPCSSADMQMKNIIYKMLEKATDMGISVILISSDFSEVSAICDRIAILSDSKLKAVYNREEILNLNPKGLL